MATTTIQPKRSTPRWRQLVLLLAAVLIVLVGCLVLWPASALTIVATAGLRLCGIEGRYVQLGPYRIHYFAGGAGEPLVLVHGLASRGLDFAPLMPALARHHRVYALDLLGYGASDRPNMDYSITLETNVLREFLDSQGLTRVDLAGWSMGGWIALDFAVQAPERVNRLVLLDSAGLKFVPAFDVRLFSPHTLAEIQELEELLTPHPWHIPGFMMRDFLRQLRAQDWVIERTVNSMLTGREVLDGKLADVTMPVLLVWGKQDAVTPLSLGEAMHRQMPQSVLVILDDCGHVAPIECYDRVLAEMQPFLSAHPPLPAGVHEVPAL